MSAGTCRNCGRNAPRLKRGLCDRMACYVNREVRSQHPAKRPQRDWTAKELIQVAELRELGMTFPAIALEVGRSERAVKIAYLRNRGPECIVCSRRCPRRSHLGLIGWQTQPAPWGCGHVVALCPGCFKAHGWGTVHERATA